MVFGEIDSFFSLIARAKSYLSKRSMDSESSIAERFVGMFNAHGVHRNQIPRLLTKYLSISDVVTDTALTKALTDEILDFSSNLFGINREWLDGATEQIYPLHDFYKNPAEFGRFIAAIKDRSITNCRGVVLRSETDDVEKPILIVLEEGIALLGEKPIYRYHFCNNWIDSYWKSRAYFTACIAIAWNQDYFLSGRYVPIDTLRKYSVGERFLDYRSDSALPTRGRRWDPEDMATKPEAFFEGLDPESDNFGLKSGLELWLDLDQKGYMETRLPYKNVRNSFKSYLRDRYSNAAKA